VVERRIADIAAGRDAALARAEELAVEPVRQQIR